MQNVLLLSVFVLVAMGRVAHADSANADAEVLAESVIVPFKNPIKKVDPVSHQPVDDVLLGPIYKAREGADFDYYRYITFYNMIVRRERFAEWPIQREQCDDDSDFFTAWSKSIAYTRTVNASVTVEGLGLGASFSETGTVTANRTIKAHGKYVTDHIPFMIKQDWEGYTYLETVNLKTGREMIMLKKKGRTPFWFAIMFPRLTLSDYPMPFSARNAEWTMDIEHRKISKCPKADPTPTPAEHQAFKVN